MDRIALYAGTFDPVHYGHIHVVNEASKLFDKTYWLLGRNANKGYHMFDLQTRMDMMKETVTRMKWDNVTPAYCDGFVVDFAKLNHVGWLVRGVRMNDYPYEFEMAMVNAKLDQMIQTIMIPAQQTWLEASSSIVRDFIKAGKSTKEYVPDFIEPYFCRGN